MSARGRRSSWTENRDRAVSALLFIWQAALATTWKHRNSGRRAADRGVMRHRQKILMSWCLYNAAAGRRKKHRRLLQVVAVQEVSRNENNCEIKPGCPPTHRPHKPVVPANWICLTDPLAPNPSSVINSQSVAQILSKLTCLLSRVRFNPPLEGEYHCAG